MTTNETLGLLQNIARRLNMRLSITKEMVDAHHFVLKNHDIELVKKARDHLVSDWEYNYFPKPKHVRDYVLLAKGGEKSKEPVYTRQPGDVSRMSARVKKLISESERNIDRRDRENDKHRDPCERCGKPALMNLTADDYYEFWNVPIIDKLKGKYLCDRCTGIINEDLEGEARQR